MSNHFRFQISPPSLFAYDLALEYLRTSPSAIIEVVIENAYRRAIRLSEKPVLLTVRPACSACEGVDVRCDASKSAYECDEVVRLDRMHSGLPLEIEVAGTSLDPSARAAAESIVRLTFGTDVDLAPIRHIARADPIFGRLIHAYAGLRPVVVPDLFETLVWAIIGQQINVRFAAKFKQYGAHVLVTSQVKR